MSFPAQNYSDKKRLTTEGDKNLYFFDTMPDSFPLHGINTDVLSKYENATLLTSAIFTFAPQTYQKASIYAASEVWGLHDHFSVRG